MDRQAKIKSGILYDVIDSSQGFYKCPIVKEFRSRINIPFTMGDSKLEAKFVAEARAHGLI